MESFIKIGHAGAAHYAQENTLRSLALALQMGVDMVEFDVRPCRDALVLLHQDDLARLPGGRGLASQSTLQELRRLDLGPDMQIPTLVEALDLVGGHALMNLDLKAAGYEAPVLEMLREKRVVGDVLISSLLPDSLRVIRRLNPAVQTGISFPEDRGNASQKPYLGPVVEVAVKLLQLTLPYRILRMMAQARADATMLYHKVVSLATVERVHRAGGRVFVWTVDDIPRMRQIRALGVDGIASNRPDLFRQL